MNKSVQAKDISDSDICTAIRRAGIAKMRGRGDDGPWLVSTGHYDGTWSNRSDVQRELEALAKREYPEKVVIAKFRSLVRRKMTEGCDCGCRGDWQLTQKGADARELPKQPTKTGPDS